MKIIRRVLEELGKLLDRIAEGLFGPAQPEPELIPIPVENRSRRTTRR